MVRLVGCASVVFAVAALVGCSGSTAANDDVNGSTNSELKKKKDGSPTGDGATCSWAETSTYDTCGANAPVPTYKLGDEFKSIDGCNECECTGKGIMCTVRTCQTPPVMPQPPPDGPICTADALKCPDGGWTSRGGPKCDWLPCGVDPKPPIACDASMRICKGGYPAKQDPNSCKQYCPEDGDVDPPVVCDASIRICKGGYPAKQDPNSCKQYCPEDSDPVDPPPYPGCDKSIRLCKDGSPGKQIPETCQQICPEDPPVMPEPPPYACTDDARQCPDGSWVGRTGPKCEFVCPPIKK